MASPRFTERAASKLREAIEEAGGVEVFAIGDVDGLGRVSDLEIHCRGNEGAVPALLTRPRPGQVVIHNHPSGRLRASDADMLLANRYGDDGIGVVITNNAVDGDLWVVEPLRKTRIPVDEDRLRRFFEEDLPRALPGCEGRDGQLQMALEVARNLHEGGVLLAEAGTGTGKSLAYLVPSVLWAQANESKVAVSTFTRNLQGQLLASDLPLMRRAGLEFEAAVLKGRSNYICRRKLDAAQADPEDQGEWLQRIRDFTERAEEGSLQELGEEVAAELWERVESDSDQTLRARCPHYDRCFYYNARRRAAQAHVLVLNHALLVADLELKRSSGGDGILPRYQRVIVDEGHHLEDAVTGVLGCTLTATALKRAMAPLLPRRRRAGALARVAERFGTEENQLGELCVQLADELGGLKEELEPLLEEVGRATLGDSPQARITEAMEQSEAWEQAQPRVRELRARLMAARNRIAVILERMDGVTVPPEQAQPLLDLKRTSKRLAEKVQVATAFLGGHEERCRWTQRGRRGAVELHDAPIEVGALLRDLLWEGVEAVTVTSATLSVAGRFDHWRSRHGVTEAKEVVLDSPFDYRSQALLVLPRDLPTPDHPDWEEAIGAALVALVQASGGGTFVLCTSYHAVQVFGARLRLELGNRFPVLIQGRSGRERMLKNFREHDSSVLVGTDSFWEGVSVSGRGLRQVIIPRLPFRVPTEPIAQARYERLVASGQDPFRAWSLPHAVLKLRQGFGRLVRTREDRGVVVLLDRRVHQRWYGRVFLAALPPARRLTGPGRVVVPAVKDFIDMMDP